MLVWDDRQEKAEQTELAAVQREYAQQKQEEEQKLKDQKDSDSFYQKLKDGFDVNILVVGDSIGAGSGASKDTERWFNKLRSYIAQTYDVSVYVTNVSMGGNVSYAGYVRTMLEDYNSDEPVNYDLAIICYGQNDSEDGFSENYESIINAIESKYTGCSVISILESSQREYTNKMQIIKALCESHNISVSDTIAPFQSEYDNLSDDGVHPNDAGQEIYFETVKNTIDENVNNDTPKPVRVDSVNDLSMYQNFKWYGTENSEVQIQGDMFERADDVTYILNISNHGMLGIDYTYESGDNKADIFIDGNLYKTPTVTFNYDFSQRHILMIDKNCAVENEIKIVFGSKAQADGFRGVCFSNAGE